MKKVTRRAALCGISGAALTALLPASSATEAPHDAAKGELFVVGPFNLGQWFDQSKPEIDGLFNLGAPNRKDIVKSLRECLFYVIDKRVWKDAKKARFADAKDDEPKIVVAGKLHHGWEGKTNSFTIQIATLKAIGTVTDYSASPPIRSMFVFVGLETAGSTILANTKCTFGFSPDKSIVYDINGRLKS